MLPATNLDNTLDTIVRDIATHATSVVEGAWNIGRLLNEARDIIGDDVEFGRWRSEKLEGDLGLDKRTAQRMQALHNAFPSLQAVGTGVNLTVLYTLSSQTLPEERRTAIMELAAARAENGERLTAREATTFAAETRTAIKQRDGRSLLDTARVAAGLDPVEAPTHDEPEQAENDTPEQAAARARRQVREEQRVLTANEEWARNQVAIIKKKQGRAKTERMQALVNEMKKHGLMAGDLVVNIRTGRIESGADC